MTFTGVVCGSGGLLCPGEFCQTKMHSNGLKMDTQDKDEDDDGVDFYRPLKRLSSN